MQLHQQDDRAHVSMTAEAFAAAVKARLDAFVRAWTDERRRCPEDYPERMPEADWMEFLLVSDLLQAPETVVPHAPVEPLGRRAA